MFGIGTTEIIVIFIVALLFLGPKRLPELARTVGRAFADFRRTASDLQSHLNVDAAPRYTPPPRPAAVPSPAPPASVEASVEKPAESSTPSGVEEPKSESAQDATSESHSTQAASESSKP